LLLHRLDTEAKNAEILRLLPLMAPFTMEFTTMQKNLDMAVMRLEQVQVRLGGGGAKKGILSTYYGSLYCCIL
jgi:hypothetical protein